MWTRGTSGSPACEGSAPAPWPTVAHSDAASEGEGATLAMLADEIASGELGPIHALLVVRDGALVFERYFPGEDWLWGQPLGPVELGPDTLHDQRSVTKSVVGVLVGIALRDGAIRDLDVPLLELLPGREPSAPALRDITLRHVLTMTAGLAWDELSHPYSDPRNDEHAMWLSEDPVGYLLARPIAAPAGSAFLYNGGLPNALAAAVETAVGEDIASYAVRELLCPLGVQRFEWVRHRSGLHVAASGLRLTPRDMARVGQLMLDEGRWGGRQIVPADFARDMLAAQVDTRGRGLAPHYGYQWWVSRRGAAAGPRDLPMAIGNGGQRIAIDRASRTVIVITAGAYDSPAQGIGPARIVDAILAIP